ncbi:MAG: hypothetical protein ACHQIO_02285 [Nevskiales bacterium]
MQKKQLHLKGWDWSNHFSPVGLLVAISVGFAWIAIHTSKFLLCGLGCALFAAFALLGVWFQRRALRFTDIRTSNSAQQNYSAIMAILVAEHWRLGHHKQGKSMVIHTPPSWFSWGERVTLLFEGSSVLANSICNPNLQSAAFGRNSRNIRVIRNAVGLPSQKPLPGAGNDRVNHAQMDLPPPR